MSDKIWSKSTFDDLNASLYLLHKDKTDSHQNLMKNPFYKAKHNFKCWFSMKKIMIKFKIKEWLNYE